VNKLIHVGKMLFLCVAFLLPSQNQVTTGSQHTLKKSIIIMKIKKGGGVIERVIEVKQVRLVFHSKGKNK